MRRHLVTILLLFTGVMSSGQVSFQTIVPAAPVVMGESFTVQYVLTGTGKTDNLATPDFFPLRLVTGPDVHLGEGAAGHTKNFVFTLMAPSPGKYSIPGAAIKYEGRLVRSDNRTIQVATRDKAAKMHGQDPGSDYQLRPGENVQEKIRQNLFVKVSVSKKTCYVGEPVMATFKLYSRLESRSDIVKNPGFYGFTVYDMVNLDDKIVATENINGRPFDVHTIRKVQLYPLQAGIFSIDAMQVHNKVELSRSAVNKKTEQEISEGILGMENDDTPPEEAEVFETDINTEPVNITVNPVPAKSKPPAFDGAVGDFSISSSLVKDKIAKNEEGIFEITIKGQGNFTQLNAPVINWPAGIEGFEPVVKDTIDKTQMPLKGNRTFRYSFACTHPGQFKLPAVEFTYFDPRSNYKTISSSPFILEVGPEEKKNIAGEEKRASISATSESASRIAIIIIISLVVIVLVYWIRYKKEPEPVKEERKPLPTVEELLGPAYEQVSMDDRAFYATLHQCTWNFFSIHFHLSGSDMNKDRLIAKMRSAGIATGTIEQADVVLKKCEAGMFTQADMAENKEALLQHTEELLKKITSELLQQS